MESKGIACVVYTILPAKNSVLGSLLMNSANCSIA
jgi:hypothetical protein